MVIIIRQEYLILTVQVMIQLKLMMYIFQLKSQRHFLEGINIVFNIIDKLNSLKENSLNTSSLFEALGEISDLFSPYLNEKIFENEILIKLWDILIYIYINNPVKENRLEALSAIYDVYIYTVNIGFSIDKQELNKQYVILRDNQKLDPESQEILEEILFDI